jgi:hypothetical protein
MAGVSGRACRRQVGYRAIVIGLLRRTLRITPSIRDSYMNLILPGTPVPGYRLYRPYGTDGVG